MTAAKETTSFKRGEENGISFLYVNRSNSKQRCKKLFSLQQGDNNKCGARWPYGLYSGNGNLLLALRQALLCGGVQVTALQSPTLKIV